MHDRAVRREEGITCVDGFAAFASRKSALVGVTRGLLLAFSLQGIEGGGLGSGLGHGRRPGLCPRILSTIRAVQEPVASPGKVLGA
jgi:hypothetical protein